MTLFDLILRAAETEAGTAAPAAPAATPAPAPAVPSADDATAEALFGETTPDAEPAATDAPAAEWKDYEPDPAKSEDENAAAKAEHDKTKPLSDEEKAAAEEKRLDSVPEDGVYTPKMPEGMEVDAELLNSVAPLFKDKNLTQRDVQAICDKFIDHGMAKAKKTDDWFVKENAKNEAACMADPVIGGDKWERTKADANRAWNIMYTPELYKDLHIAGVASKPTMVAALARIGREFAEDEPVSGGTPATGVVPTENILFANDVPKGR